MLGVCNYRTMEAKARLVLSQYCFKNLRDASAIPIEQLIEALGLEIDYQYLTKDGQKILGKLICVDGYTPYYDMELHQYMLLKVKADTILVEARLAELSEAKKTIGALKREIIKLKLDAIAPREGNITIFDSTLDGNAMREFATIGMTKTKGIFSVFATTPKVSILAFSVSSQAHFAE